MVFGAAANAGIANATTQHGTMPRRSQAGTRETSFFMVCGVSGDGCEERPQHSAGAAGTSIRKGEVMQTILLDFAN